MKNIILIILFWGVSQIQAQTKKEQIQILSLKIDSLIHIVNTERDLNAIEKNKYEDKFKIYFKEFNDPLNFECGTFKDAFFRPSKGEFLYNATLYKYLTTALCNTTLSDDGKLKSVPNVKYVKNDTQGSPNQTNTQTLAENKKTNNIKVKKVLRLTESQLKEYISKIISENKK